MVKLDDNSPFASPVSCCWCTGRHAHVAPHEPLEHPLCLAHNLDTENRKISSNGSRRAPFIKWHRFRAELQLVWMVTDREVVNGISGLDRSAQRILDGEKA